MPENHNNELIAGIMPTVAPTVRIKVRNGRWLDAVQLNNGLYRATMSRGYKTYGDADIIAIQRDNGVPMENTTNDTHKEGTMNNSNTLYHFLHKKEVEVTNEDGVVEKEAVYNRYITSFLPGWAEKDYHQSVKTRQHSNEIMAISTGEWKFHFLNYVATKAPKLQVCIMDLGKLRNMGEDGLEIVRKAWDRADFSYATASSGIFMSFYGTGSIESLGINAAHTRKISKRLMELTRLSQIGFIEEGAAVDLFMYDYKGQPVQHFDGMSYARYSVVCEWIRKSDMSFTEMESAISDVISGKRNRFIFRLGQDGLFKGDLVAVPDFQIDHDIVTIDENLKAEYSVNGIITIALMDHHPRHTAVWDDQTTVNFPAALPLSKQISDLHRMKAQLDTMLAGGELPSWITGGANAHTDDGTVDVHRISDAYHLANNRWVINGRTIQESANFMRMAWGAAVNKMDTPMIGSRSIGLSFHEKTYVPMTNAVLGAVVTYESATKMGGFSFPGEDGSRVFWDERLGFVIPGKRFEQTYALHGGWDLDDSLKGIMVKVFASAPVDEYLGSVIDENVVLPADRDQAIDMLLMLRSPNGAGEYSLELYNPVNMFDADVLDPNQIIVIDLAKMPKPLDVMLQSVEVRGLPPISTQYTKEQLTREDTWEMLKTQMVNPGFGRYCNAMIAWVATFKALPDSVLDVTEEIVDACQQGYDSVRFEAIEKESKRIVKLLVAKAIATNTKVDAAIAVTRMPEKARRELHKAGLIAAGRYTKFHREYNTVLNNMRVEITKRAFEMRHTSPLAQRVLAKQMSSAMFHKMEELHATFNNRLAAGQGFKIDPRDHAFLKMEKAIAKREAFEDAVARNVQQLLDMELSDRYATVVNLYKFTLLKLRKHTIGTEVFQAPLDDQVIFQPSAKGAINVMDILLEAIEYYDAQ